MASNTAPKKAPPKAKKPATAGKGAGVAVRAPKKIAASASKAKSKPLKRQKSDAPPKAAATPSPAPAALEPRQECFVREYLIDLNATQAAIRAGYSDKTARQMGAENLSKPSIQTAIAKAQQERAERTGIAADQALREAWNVAIADARELVQVKVGCCRYCYGDGNRYQRTVGEMNRDREAWAEKKDNAPADFDEKGGIGYDPLRMPFAACPECGGDGQPRVVLGDTRNLSPAAVSLYAGAKQTKDGIEIKIQDRGAALEKVFKHLGLYQKDNEQKIDPLTALLQTITGGTNSTFKPVPHDPEHDED